MTKIAKFNVAISELIDVPNPNDTQHPFATIAKFIFADDQPNGNKQGIRLAEFPSVITSAIGMPIKMNFTGIGVANHGGSIPIGHIKSMESTVDAGVNQIVAEAMLWKEEFPDEIEYLKNAYAEKKAPGLSYEIAFTDSTIEDETQWITGTTTQAATFVSNPAYGSRTRLLALASLDEEERNTEILAMADQIKLEKPPEVIIEKGGNRMEELELAKAEVTRLTAEAATKDARILELETNLATAGTEKETVVAELETLKTSAKVDNRIRQYVEAGYVMETDEEKAAARKAVFSSYLDAQWDMYLADLKNSKPKEKGNALAALSRASLQNDIPKIDIDETDNGNLKDAMRLLARPHSI